MAKELKPIKALNIVKSQFDSQMVFSWSHDELYEYKVGDYKEKPKVFHAARIIHRFSNIRTVKGGLTDQMASRTNLPFCLGAQPAAFLSIL